jgi:putative lipoprotein
MTHISNAELSRWHRPRWFALAITATLALCAGQASEGAESATGHDMITGTVAYVQRVALAPDAIVAISLVDVTLADGPSKLVIEQRFPATGRPGPIAFRLPYDPAAIEASHRYNLRATITAHGRLICTTTGAYPVLTGSGTRKVDLVLQAISSPARPSVSALARPGGPATLDKTYWRLTELGGAPVAVPANKREAHLIFRTDGQHVAGTSGCNRLIGTFETGPDSALKLNVGGMTTMACPDPMMTQERNLLDALKAVTSYRIDGEKLELRNGDQVLARLESRVRK